MENNKKFHIELNHKWESFNIGGVYYDLSHLNPHLLLIKSNKMNYEYIVTYSMHCFCKDNTGFNLSKSFKDKKEERMFCKKRYKGTFRLYEILLNLNNIGRVIVEQSDNVFYLDNNIKNKEIYRMCFTTFKENRKLRIHISSSFYLDNFDENKKETSKTKKTIYKISHDLYKSKKKR